MIPISQITARFSWVMCPASVIIAMMKTDSRGNMATLPSACAPAAMLRMHQMRSKLLSNEMPDACYACHEKAKFTKKTVHAVVSMPGGCTLCHTPHVSNDKAMLVQPLFELCTSCHANKSDGRHIVSIPGKEKNPSASRC